MIHLSIIQSVSYHVVNVSLLTAEVIHQSLKAMLLFTHLKFKQCSNDWWFSRSRSIFFKLRYNITITDEMWEETFKSRHTLTKTQHVSILKLLVLCQNIIINLIYVGGVGGFKNTFLWRNRHHLQITMYLRLKHCLSFYLSTRSAILCAYKSVVSWVDAMIV